MAVNTEKQPVNLNAVFFGTQAAIKAMVEAGHPRLIVVKSSLAATHVRNGFAAYSAVESGVCGSVLAAADDLGCHNIQLNRPAMRSTVQ